ncbi:MAG: hypothetical protein GX488_11665 [Clostridiales bacterium]|nr:hypothetical protein [Clostridiales bacterium]
MPNDNTENKTPESNKPQTCSTKLTRANDLFMPMIERQLTDNGIVMTDYQKQCVLMAIAGMNALLDREGLGWNSESFDSRNVTEMLQTVAALQLNAAANPREIYFQTRNVKVKTPDGGEKWKKQIEMGIEGDGNDSILRRFGADVKKVGQFWLVREGDEFVYPRHKGFDITPPEWTETGKGKVVRIVYPILKRDDTVEFYIAERDDVKKNLAAHISNNLMNETFGICENRYKATADQLKKIAEKKKEILSLINGRSIDEILDDPVIQEWASPSWTEMHSRESMLIRKMRNNIVKKIPKDFSNAYIASAYMNAADDTRSAITAEIEENANSTLIDVDYSEIPTDPDTGEVLTDAPLPDSNTDHAKQEKGPEPIGQTDFFSAQPEGNSKVKSSVRKPPF